MVLKITQKTFDEAVKENIDDLGLSQQEAVSEAINQFRAQGVDLSLIVTDIAGGANFEVITSAITKIKENDDPAVLIENLSVLKKECDKGIQYKVQAGREGAYDVILTLFCNQDSLEVKIACMSTMVALMSKQPDLLDSKGAEIITNHLDMATPTELQKLILKWCKECCLMHEMNRQTLFELDIVGKIKPIIVEAKSEHLKDVLAISRALILDDDVRVEFGRAHEHAKVIAGETLGDILKLLDRFKNDESLVNDLMLTMSSLLVRTEFCLAIEEAGGVELIKEIMTNYPQSEKVARQSLKLIKALAGNDLCKSHIIQKGLAPVISTTLANNQASIPAACAGLNCVAALSLRCPDNSKALFEAGMSEVIINIMKRHPNEKLIQKPASWAIRNMVSRSRYQNSRFIELGAEDLLKRCLGVFKEFEYDIKAALRDLECDVELKEEWTGKGGKIFTETTKPE